MGMIEGMTYEQKRAHIEIALKEQDKITRHACAAEMTIDKLLGNNHSAPAKYIIANAQRACINVNAIG